MLAWIFTPFYFLLGLLALLGEALARLAARVTGTSRS
jgi:hypothetical protein